MARLRYHGKNFLLNVKSLPPYPSGLFWVVGNFAEMTLRSEDATDIKCKLTPTLTHSEYSFV